MQKEHTLDLTQRALREVTESYKDFDSMYFSVPTVREYAAKIQRHDVEGIKRTDFISIAKTKEDLETLVDKKLAIKMTGCSLGAQNIFYRDSKK